MLHLPSEGRLFPGLTVNQITKGFAKLRAAVGLETDSLVFHSTRKWFITQCERTGVPEHFTASLVGHKSARSENKLNRLCINPEHLELGSQADNKRDDWEHWAGGTDPDFL